MTTTKNPQLKQIQRRMRMTEREFSAYIGRGYQTSVFHHAVSRSQAIGIYKTVEEEAGVRLASEIILALGFIPEFSMDEKTEIRDAIEASPELSFVGEHIRRMSQEEQYDLAIAIREAIAVLNKAA